MNSLKNPYSKLDLAKEINPTALKQAEEMEIRSYLKENPDHKVLNCGSGNTTLIDGRVIHLDVFKYKVVDIISDASDLPFKEESFNAIFCHAVLEHVENPFKVVSEFTRVLKKDGYVSVSIPFLFPFHDVPDHYFNVSTSGIKSLFKDFNKIDSGVLLGPWYALYNIIGNYKKMLKRVYKDPKTSFWETLRIFIIYRLLSWGMKFDHKSIALTDAEENILAGGVFFKGKKR